MALFGRTRPKSVPVPPIVADGSWLQWPTIAWGGLHGVVGESYCQDALSRVAAQHPGRMVTAQLVREPTNPHDRNAVMVQVGGGHVGYLARDLAPFAHGLIDALHAQGRPATCRAELTGDAAEKPRRGMTLHVEAWEPFLPGTPFLDGSRSSIVTVTKEAEHQEALDALLREHPDGRLVVDLGRAPEGGIGVYAERQLLGELTAKMSERYAPMLWQVYNAGLRCSCRAHVSRDDRQRLQAELTLMRPPGEP